MAKRIEPMALDSTGLQLLDALNSMLPEESTVQVAETTDTVDTDDISLASGSVVSDPPLLNKTLSSISEAVAAIAEPIIIHNKYGSWNRIKDELLPELMTEVDAGNYNLAIDFGWSSGDYRDVTLSNGETIRLVLTDPGHYTIPPIWQSCSTLPYNFYDGSAVVYNNEIHILGGGGGNTRHYKWNGSSWTSVSTLPYEFDMGSAVVYNNEIHILGGPYESGHEANHYKYNGSSWTSVSTLPYNFYSGSAVVYNNEIHIFGGSDGMTNHYKWNGSSWTSVSTLPYNFQNGRAIVYNNAIHIVGGGNINKLFKWNGSSWVYVNAAPYKINICSAVVYNNELNVLGGGETVGESNKHSKYDGTKWSDAYVSIIPYWFTNGEAVVYNNEIHILGGSYNGTYKNHYCISTTENGKCNFTVVMQDGLSDRHVMNSSGVNTGSWDKSEMRAWLNSDVLNMFPPGLKSVLKTFNVITATEYNASTVTISQDKLAIFAEKEFQGARTYSNVTEANALTQLDYFKTELNKIKAVSDPYYGDHWYGWLLRSPKSDDTGYYCSVKPDGSVNYCNAGSRYGVCFYGCI